MIKNKKDVSIQEISHKREKNIFHTHKLHNLPETKKRHGKLRYANIVRGS